MTGAVFDDLAGRLGDRTCAAPDLPGHGRARHLPPSPDNWAACVAETLAALPGAVAVGWSMGAMALWHCLDRHGPGDLAGLITVDMSPRLRPAPDWPHGLLGQSEGSLPRVERRLVSDWEGASHGIAASIFASGQEAPHFTRAMARDMILTQDADTMRAAWQALVGMDKRAAVADIALPWLVCSGAQSRVYPASASDWLARTAPRTLRHVFAKSGHAPHLQEPDSFARVVAAFADAL